MVFQQPARARQWAKDKADGKKPSPLYQPRVAQPDNEIVEARNETVQSKGTEKPKSLCATFTDPRMLFKKD
jgi:hypothetical protein